MASEVNGTLENGEHNMQFNSEPSRPSAEEMDRSRHDQVAYEYLCRLEEAREWIQSCLEEPLPPLIEFEKSFQNGVVLARLANRITPDHTPMKIYDMDEVHYKEGKLEFRHTENITNFLKTIRRVGLPTIFYPEIVDIYDKKNMPKAVYCIHALSHYLSKRYGHKYPTLKGVTEVVDFTEEEISNIAKELAKYDITMPAFGKIRGILAKEMPVDEVGLHAAVIAINKIIDRNDADLLTKALQSPNAHITNVYVEYKDYYQRNLAEVRMRKRNATDLDESVESSVDDDELYSYYLTQGEIQHGVDESNEEALLDDISSCAYAEDYARLQRLLTNPIMQLRDIHLDYADYYLFLMKHALAKKSAAGLVNPQLTPDEIQNIIWSANAEKKAAIERALISIRINRLIESKAGNRLILNALRSFAQMDPNVEIKEEKCDAYAEKLRYEQAHKLTNESATDEFILTKTIDGYYFLVCVESGKAQPCTSEEQVKNLWYLSADEIEYLMLKVNGEWHLKHGSDEENLAAAKIQAAWRAYNNREKSRESPQKRAWEEEEAKKKEEAARKIQNFYRKYKPHKDYRELMDSTVPKFVVVQKFLNLLDETDLDYEEELEIERLKVTIIKSIHQQKRYDQDLDELDLKIGLLIRNRITLDEVLAHKNNMKMSDEKRNRSLKRRSSSVSSTGGGEGKIGFDALSKSGRQRLQAYQNLLYLLTRNPKYLSRLIYDMPEEDANKFLDTIVITLFNYGSRAKDEYLLMRFFETAMEEETKCKLRNPSDIPAGKSIIIGHLLNFAKNHSDKVMKNMLRTHIQQLLQQNSQQLNTNPVEVYQAWVHDVEKQTGHAADLPMDVTPQAALKHQEVKSRVHAAICALEKTASEYFATITQYVKDFPYSIRHFCKTLKELLAENFPREQQSDIQKAVGNVIFYRYIHSAIASPENYGVLEEEESRALTVDDRKKLQAVARLLQCAASHKGYGEDNSHLVELNGYIEQSYENFKRFFDDFCKVEDLEEHFGVDQYNDYVAFQKSCVIISIHDLITLHKLLMKHLAVVAPDLSDPLRELLMDLGGSEPTLFDIIGHDADEATLARAQTVDLVLTLTNKFMDHSDAENLRQEFLQAKKYLVDIMLCQRAKSVVELLHLPVSVENEQMHNALISHRTNDSENHERITLAQKKMETLNKLTTLEKAGLVSRANGYADIISSIAKDIRNQGHFRSRRHNEKTRLLDTVEKMNKKYAYYKEQLDYYDKYLQSCLDNLAAEKQKDEKTPAGTTRSTPIKYSAAKLHKKGVLVSIEGASAQEMKNINIEIKPAETKGTFEIGKRYLKGLELETLSLQDLLQKQYENHRSLVLFRAAIFDVDALIYLLNRKFYSKK